MTPSIKEILQIKENPGGGWPYQISRQISLASGEMKRAESLWDSLSEEDLPRVALEEGSVEKGWGAYLCSEAAKVILSGKTSCSLDS
jgi:hypothetical protein